MNANAAPWRGRQPLQIHIVRQPHRRIAELLAQVRVEPRRRCDLHNLLVPPLQRAVALPDMHRRLAVARDLDLDMARIGHQRLGIDQIVAE